MITKKQLSLTLAIASELGKAIACSHFEDLVDGRGAGSSFNKHTYPIGRQAQVIAPFEIPDWDNLSPEHKVVVKAEVQRAAEEEWKELISK